ncbi:MAG TPA: efflux RND transporter periplasmic adaptor subunit [Acetobacteraceae bacterium]
MKGLSSRMGWLVGGLVTLLLAMGVAGDHWLAAPSAAQAPPPAPSAVPVSTARATRQDYQVFLTGLGAAQALNSVLVRSRVDGTLMDVPVTEGQEVKKGDVIAIIDPRPFKAALDQAMAKKQQDEAQLGNVKRDVGRTQSLVKQDFASHQTLDTQESQVDQLTAAIAGDQAAIEAAQLNLSYCYITSPINGRVGLRMVDPGNLIHASDSTGIITVTQIRPIAVTFTLPQQDLPQISAAMARGKLPVRAFAPDGKTNLGTGELLTIDSAIDATTGTIKLKAVFPNANNQLWPGQFVNADVLVSTDHDVLTVPSIAVQHGPEGLYAYIVKPDGTVSPQGVKLVADNGQISVIAGGIKDGQEVVVQGQSRLQDGTRVTATPMQSQTVASSAGSGT